jgi:rifampicin phosphotransferase
MNSYVHNFNETIKFTLSGIGGKGFNLIELSKIEGIYVPEGFCVTTEVYKNCL